MKVVKFEIILTHKSWNPCVFFFSFSLYKFLFHNIHGTQSLVPLSCFASNEALDIFPIIKLFQEGTRDCLLPSNI